MGVSSPSDPNPSIPTKVYKIGIVGSWSTGRHSFCRKFLKDKFEEGLEPTPEENGPREFVSEGKSCRIELIDTAGREEFQFMHYQHFSECNVFIILYDPNVSWSFQAVEWFRNAVISAKTHSGEPVDFVLVSTKSDTPIEQRQVSKEIAEAVAKKWDIRLFETSAKTGENIQEVFRTAVELCVNQPLPAPIPKKKSIWRHFKPLFKLVKIR
eukprot:TRINITY_DN1644_c0_g1_i2.p1 TRINITY_DN1644_c0_g1~~TRINITY_DN1644_c0_g1_i2.p1  ORF type:complete len:211 (-),score=47.40 TRINITY_DN1644_c0_g1_i2:60-692(-)